MKITSEREKIVPTASSAGTVLATNLAATRSGYPLQIRQILAANSADIRHEIADTCRE
uniref:Uncharacterized protein n=1 Tax=Rhizophagus irregularis (strain DAOM 181602 / DAOM 197198 / MUCL 43194) TaxID=747089 RepID=U9UDD9_RHIID